MGSKFKFPWKELLELMGWFLVDRMVNSKSVSSVYLSWQLECRNT